jgi:uncharacterized protein YxjI
MVNVKSPTAIDPRSVQAALESADRILVQQVFKALANEYRISVPPPGSTREGHPLLYVRQKMVAMKEDIRFRLSPEDEGYLFKIRSRSVFEFRGRHDVLDAQDYAIGVLEKSFGRSLLRSHWRVRDAAGNAVLESEESSVFIALLRRFAGFLPDGLDLLSSVPFHFNLYREGTLVARYDRVFAARDRYLLEVEPELAGVDRRLLIAFAVGLDALQDR